jgi:DNA-binding transcriptional MerR regulator
VRIGELARRTAVSERSLRYYEARGLIAAGRTRAGYRDFPEGTVDRVILVQHLFAAGLCSSKVARLLPCLDEADAGPAAGATELLHHALVEEAERLDRDIRGLQRARAVLDELLHRTAHLAPSEARRGVAP